MQNKEDNPDNSFFSKAMNPFIIAGIALAGALLFMILGIFTNSIGVTQLSERFPYVSAGSFLLLFAVYNAVFSLNSEDLNKYWLKSIAAYVVLVAGSAGLAYAISGLWMPGTFGWIFSILTFGYLAFLSIMGMVKNVFTIIKKEDEKMHGKW